MKNFVIIKRIAIRLLLIISLTLTAGVAAAAEQEAKITVPATAVDIWHAIDRQMAELHAAVDQNRLGSVHVHAFAVRDLVRALPDRSVSLSAEQRKTVKEQSKFVDTLAARLDATGDANDKPGTDANLAKLESVLQSIASQYRPAK
jgi:hypothetical protein